MARDCHTSTLRRLELGHQKSQAIKTEIACKSYQEGRNETQTNQSETCQDCIDYYTGKPRAFLHSNDSNPTKYCIMDSPYETLKSVTALKQVAEMGRRACRDKDYNGSEFFHRIVRDLDDLQWEIEETIPEWEKIMKVQ